MIKLKIVFFGLAQLIFCTISFGQNLAAYTDYMGRFYVFDSGESIKVDDLPPLSLKVGGTCVLFASSAGHLVMYSKGKVTELERSGVTEYFATDHLAAYNIYEKLKVVYNGEVITLSSRCSSYNVSDSLICFYDENSESFNVFYRGEIFEIESGLIGRPISFWAAGDNIVAYISSRNNDFKIWYQGITETINRNVSNTSFKAGRNIVAYTDEVEQNFKAYYKGKVFLLDDFLPQSFKVADDMVAFVSQTGDFKVFSDGEIQLINSFEPQSYIAKDNLLAFNEDGYFKIWYKGEVYEIEAYVPEIYKFDWNTVAYLDQSNRIWLFQDGEKKYLTNELIHSFDLYRGLILLHVKVNRNLIYFKNQFYDGLSQFK
ncbi:MAG: hypothetical protein JXA77_14115 [Bacteroidales bacterium]|nr:hypothetical protein [Bacteroidales bacterium]MBN2819239.1 hypothetical protein [Bacteroidales bacterium]